MLIPDTLSSAGKAETPAVANRRPTVLEVSGLRKQYVQSKSVRPALESVSLAIREGEVVGLLGPNGAGKTTLLKILATLIEPDSGQVCLFGRDIAKDPRAARRHIGLVTCDERSFYWRLSGFRNLEFFATLYRVPRRAARERIAMLLETLGLAEAADRPYHSYSTGMRQKMAIARGLLSDPRFVLYDEPTRSLDPLSSQNIRLWILENRRRFPGTTHLIATNQLHEAEQLCERVVILNRGRLIADDSIEQIRQRFRRTEQMSHRIQCRGFRLSGRLRAAPEEGLLEIEEHASGDGECMLVAKTTAGGTGMSFVLSAILGSGGVVVRCETEQMALEEIFCSLVKEQTA